MALSSTVIRQKINDLTSQKAEFIASVDECLEKLRNAKTSLGGLKNDLKTDDAVLKAGLNPGIKTSYDAINTAITNIEAKKQSACTKVDKAIDNLRWQLKNAVDNENSSSGQVIKE